MVTAFQLLQRRQKQSFQSIQTKNPRSVVCFGIQILLMNEMNIGLSEIIDNTRLGREFALLGNYESSLVYYEGVLQQISRLLGTINDHARAQQWQEVRISQSLNL